MAYTKEKIQQIDSEIEELTKLKNQAQLPNVQDYLQKEINRLVVCKQDCMKESNNSTSMKKEEVKRGEILVTNYMWDQTHEYVKIYIELGKEDKIDNSEITLTFQSENQFSCIFGKYRFTLGRLLKPIDESKSKAFITKSNKFLQITLCKKKAEKWSSLQTVQNLLSKPDLKDENPEKALMDLMRKMYDEGDDELKRSIAKSWYESQQKHGMME